MVISICNLKWSRYFNGKITELHGYHLWNTMEHSWCILTNQLVQMQFGLADTGCSGVAFFLPVKVCDQSACFTRGSLEAWGKILVCRVVNGLEGPTRYSRDRQVKQSGPHQTFERHSGDITWPIFGSLVPYQLWILIGSDGKASKQATACQLAVELRQLLGRRTDPAVEDLHRPDPTGCAAQYHSEARVGSSQYFLGQHGPFENQTGRLKTRFFSSSTVPPTNIRIYHIKWLSKTSDQLQWNLETAGLRARKMILICLMTFLDGNCMFLGSVGFQGFKQRWDRSSYSVTPPPPRRGRSESFEVYGFDFLIGEDLKPWRPGLEHGHVMEIPPGKMDPMDFNKNLETPAVFRSQQNCPSLVFWRVMINWKLELHFSCLEKSGQEKGRHPRNRCSRMFDVSSCITNFYPSQLSFQGRVIPFGNLDLASMAGIVMGWTSFSLSLSVYGI